MKSCDFDVNRFLHEIDSSLEHSRDIFRQFDAIHRIITDEDWEIIQLKVVCWGGVGRGEGKREVCWGGVGRGEGKREGGKLEKRWRREKGAEGRMGGGGGGGGEEEGRSKGVVVWDGGL